MDEIGVCSGILYFLRTPLPSIILCISIILLSIKKTRPLGIVLLIFTILGFFLFALLSIALFGVYNNSLARTFEHHENVIFATPAESTDSLWIYDRSSNMTISMIFSLTILIMFEKSKMRILFC